DDHGFPFPADDDESVADGAFFQVHGFQKVTTARNSAYLPHSLPRVKSVGELHFHQSMQIAILGTGMVGQTLATKLIQIGHQVMMGSRTATSAAAQAW